MILSQERFLRKVEITVNAWDHALVGVGTDRDLVTAADGAVDRLEKQVLKVRTKFRDTKRRKGKEAGHAAGGGTGRAFPPRAGRNPRQSTRGTASNARKSFASTIATAANP